MKPAERETKRKNKNRRAAILCCAALILLLPTGLSSCDKITGSSAGDPVRREVFAMDTIMDLTVYGADGGEAMNQAVNLIHRYETLFSVTNPDSDVAKINRADGEAVSVSSETWELLERGLAVSESTDGAFDVSIYPLVKAWGFTTGKYRVPERAEREQALKKVDYRKIRLLPDNRVQIEKGMELDLGAVAKGYLSQKLMELFRKCGVDSAIVSLGGNVQTMGRKENGEPFVVGITDPADGSGIYGTLTVENRAVVTSGIYQRYFTEGGRQYHHIMDKSTGMPAENGLASVTVVTEDGARADALATALYVMGEKRALEYQKANPDIELVLIRRDGTCFATSGLSFQRNRAAE